jgi:hypothetical protein
MAIENPRSDSSIADELLQWMKQDPADDEALDASFQEWALRLFAYQFDCNLPYQNFCRQRSRTPRTVRRWQDIPAVPIQAFKEFLLTCIPVEHCERVFKTSGTTQGDVKGQHFHPHLRVYDGSMRLNFEQRFMRLNAWGASQSLRMGLLFPDEAQLPHSSLAHYLQLAMHYFGSSESQTLVSTQGLRVDALVASLQDAVDRAQPYALLGASYSLVHAMDALQARGVQFKLPLGSRILDTGGFKGQAREVPVEAFYAQLTHTFGVPASACINMYGMTELSTQFYDEGHDHEPALKSGPHWIRTRVVDPVSGQDCPAGVPGILVHCDLANFNSVTTILTEDLGQSDACDGGYAATFALLGRAQGAHPKGCSLTAEDFLQARQA